ncbi:hypothetical protein Barb7_03017 [Bacteroidales bacterium Barb7]|nr:hypothetical protein Barb7_03017 [Bacteroidales bacterium Barb7]
MITEIREDFKRLDRTVRSNNKMLSEMGKTVSDISAWIMKKDNLMVDTLRLKHSPYVLVPIGYVLLDESGATEALDSNMEYLIQELEEEKPKTPYDVERKAAEVLLHNSDHDMFVGIKHYLYYSPAKVTLTDPETGEKAEIEPSMYMITQLMSIPLRDEYLERHPDIR